MSSVFDYDDRVVLYLDILGWRSKITSSATDGAVRQRLAEIAELLERVSAEYGNRRENDRAIAQFSDTLVLSLKHNTYSIRAILRYTRSLCRALLERGFIARGGIAHGRLHHRGAIMFGPALIEAYDIEHGIARVPRVVLSESARGACKTAEEAFDGEGRRLGIDQMIRRDVDGAWFVDYLCAARVFSFREPWNVDPEADEEEERQNEAIRGVLVHLQDATIGDSSVATKYRWLVGYYNSVFVRRPIPLE